MGTHEEAIAAIDALDSKYTWEGMESPMVVKWMDAALQRRRREQHLAAMRQGLVPSMGLGGLPPHAAHPGRYQQHHTGMTMMRMPHHAGNNSELVLVDAFQPATSVPAISRKPEHASCSSLAEMSSTAWHHGRLSCMPCLTQTHLSTSLVDLSDGN
jgi:hypothetical protein